MGTFRSQSNSVCDKARKNAINASSLDRILHPTICVSYYWWHKTCLFFDSLLGFWANAVQLPLKIIQSFLWYIHPWILLILPFLSTFQFKHFLSSSWQRWNKTKQAFSSPGLLQNGICLVFVFYVHQQQVLRINWDKRHQKICRCHLIHVYLSVGVYDNSELVMCWRH